MTTRRRANGEGSVYQRHDDPTCPPLQDGPLNEKGRPTKERPDHRCHGTWVAAVVLPDTGKRKVLYGKSRTEALAKRREVLRDLEDGMPVSSRAPGTVGAWVEGEWLGMTLPSRVAAGTLSPDTLDSYADNWRLHLAPSLGDVRWDKLTPARIRSWQTELLTKPSGRQRQKLRPGETELPPPKLLSNRTVAYCHAVLRKALNDAMRDEVPGVRRNVVSLVEPPKVGRGGKGRPLDVDQVTAVLAAIEDDPLRVLWLTYLGLGLRRGEGLALRWSRIDLDAGTVQIAKSIKRRRTAEVTASGRRRGQLVEDDPKTEASAATLAVPKPVIAVWREHSTAQKTERMAAKVWADPDLLFTTGVGTAIEPRNVNRAWEMVCERAGVPPIRVHDLRHTMATLMLRQGVDVGVVQRMMRHTRRATTSDVYTTVLEEVQRAGADRMGDFFTELGVGV